MTANYCVLVRDQISFNLQQLPETCDLKSVCIWSTNSSWQILQLESAGILRYTENHFQNVAHYLEDWNYVSGPF